MNKINIELKRVTIEPDGPAQIRLGTAQMMRHLVDIASEERQFLNARRRRGLVLPGDETRALERIAALKWAAHIAAAVGSGELDKAKRKAGATHE